MAYDFFEQYDLDQTSSQKRYNSTAAQYYRDRIRRSLDAGFLSPNLDKAMPTWEEGRQPYKFPPDSTNTEQINSYSSIDCKFTELS